MTYIVKFKAEVKDPNDPDFLRMDAAAEKVAAQYCTKTSKDGWSVYTFANKKLAMEFRNSPQHQEAMRNVARFYEWFEVEREEV